MSTVEANRRKRLAQLRGEFGSLARLNDLLNLRKNDSTLSQYGSPSNPKPMGSQMARRLEKVTGKPEGWMDSDPDAEARWPFPLVDPSQWAQVGEEAQLELQRIFNFHLALALGKVPVETTAVAHATELTRSTALHVHEPSGKPYRAGHK